jgi:putative PIN family toxin of toxin-antitoxin system
MIRVVIDTNILVSALLKPQGIPAAVVMLALSRMVQPSLSEEIFAEYDEVLRRPRFNLPADNIEGSLLSIRRLSHWVKPSVPVKECADPDDNMFLECALAAEADYLVTGNLRHFPGRWKKKKVIRARELMELMMARR